MSRGGFTVDPAAGTLQFYRDTVAVLAHQGKMVRLLPNLIDVTKTVVFPHFKTDIWWHYYNYTDVAGHGPGGAQLWNHSEAAQVFFTAIPQETEVVQNAEAVPAGCDFVVGRVFLRRTVAPKNTWQGLTIPVLPRESEWIGWHGSALMEQRRNMARALHIVIDPTGKQLQFVAEQSVGVPPSGWGPHGDVGFSASGSFIQEGSYDEYLRVQGTPVYSDPSHFITLSLGGRTAEGIQLGTGGGGEYYLFKRGSRQPSAPPTIDVTNYSSTYSVRFQGFFGSIT